MLKRDGLDRLSERRQKIFDDFAKKCAIVLLAGSHYTTAGKQIAGQAKHTNKEYFARTDIMTALSYLPFLL